MNQNKGIVGLGLIVAIVLGIVVVGGGAYYLGTKKNIEIKNPENVLPNIENQNLPVVESLKTPQEVVSDCNSSSKPSIKVLSPNGGEVYNSGNRITVKWTSCNVAVNTQLIVGLSMSVSSGAHTTSIPVIKNTLNDGSESFVLDNTIYDYFGKTEGYPFKIYIGSGGSTGVYDESNNSFTINSAATVSTADWKIYTDSDYGFNFQYPNTWSLYYGPDNVVNLNGEIMAREINFINTADKNATEGSGSTFRTTLSVKYNLPPNGAESYNYAVSEFNSKNGWYKTGSKEIQVTGNKAIQAFTTMSVDGKGHKIDPALRLIIVDFLDKQKTGSIQLQFKTPLPNEGIEVPNFERLLSTFKFN